MHDTRHGALPEPSASATLRPRSGKSRDAPGAHVTVENVREFHAAPEAVAAAVEALAAKGFTVRGQSPLSLSFSGPKELFERVFNVTLTAHRYDPLTGEKSPAGRSVHWTAAGPLQVPAELGRYIERVTFSPPFRFFDGGHGGRGGHGGIGEHGQPGTGEAGD